MQGLGKIITLLIAINVVFMVVIYNLYAEHQQKIDDHNVKMGRSQQQESLKSYLDVIGYEHDKKTPQQQGRFQKIKGRKGVKTVPDRKDLKLIKRLRGEYEDQALALEKVRTSVNDMAAKMALANPLRELGGYPEVEEKHFNGYPRQQAYYKTPLLGLKKNPAYCDIIDMKNLFHSDSVYNKMTFLADYIPRALARKKVMKVIGVDGNPKSYIGMKGMKKAQHEMNPNTTLIFTKRVNVHSFLEVGRQIGCISQMYGHMPGHGMLTRKDLNVKMVNEYAKKYADKPKCFNKNTYFPYSYRLNNEYECTQFFKELETLEYKERRKTEPVTFVIKKGYGAHRARGLEIFDQEKEVELKEFYNNGKKCGTIKKADVAQYYISDPLLLDLKNKFDFRMYILIASTNPLIVYYHDGFIRASLSEYDKHSKNVRRGRRFKFDLRNIHFTNTHLSKKIFKKAAANGTYEGKTEQEWRDYQMWTMEELAEYLIETNQVSDPKWLDNHLRNHFKKAFVHIGRMVEPYVLQSSSVFEFFGIDFMIDEKLNLWFIECNASPQLIGTNKDKTKFLVDMLSEMFELEHAYMRSRWRRVQNFMKEYYEEIFKHKTISDKEKWSKKLKKALKNKMDPEFEPKGITTWKKIVDKNLKGADAYFDYLDEECLFDDEN